MSRPTGRPIGRPPILTPEQHAEVYEKLGLEVPAVQLADRYGVERGTIYLAWHRERRRRFRPLRQARG